MDLELRRYITPILRWWWLIILSTGLAAGLSYFASLQQPPIYQTTTTLMVGQVFKLSDPTAQDFTLPQQLAESYAQMARRQPVLQATVDNLGLEVNWQSLKNRVYAAPIPRTQLLAINVSDTSPERAVAIADEIAYQLILQSPAASQNEYRQERSQFITDQLDDLEARIEGAKSQMEELETELDTALSARQIQDLQNEKAALESLINSWQANYAELLNFLEGQGSPNYLTVIESAQLPSTPVSPNVRLNVLLAAAAGFVLALGGALLLEYIDDTVKSTEDLQTSLGLNVLGSILYIKGEGYRDRLITGPKLFSSISEAYRLVRTNIQFMSVDRPVKSILLASPNSGEGKSTTAANLGVIMAQANLKTIIVDADLRRPVMHKIFQLSNQAGLTDLLCSPEDQIEKHLKNSTVENLQVITTGPLPPNPAEMLGSQRMVELLRQLEEVADVVIFDSSPVLAVTDATILSGRVDGVILVTKAKSTRRDTIKHAITRLDQVGAKLLGGLLNQVPNRRGSYSHYPHYTYPRDRSSQQVNQPDQRRHWWRRLFAFRWD